jgi:N-acetylmuramoyl-L-alanine amidase
MTPNVIVNHYTTGWSGTVARDWLLGVAGNQPTSRVSAHLVIDRDGTAWQIAPFNRIAWHAGPSRFGNLTGLNGHAIGIEFVNPGWLKPLSAGRWADYYQNVRTTAQLEDFGGFITARHPRVGSQEYAWPIYTPAQIETGLAITRALIAHYGIKHIVTHEEIDTRGWKTDPGPAFPQAAFAELTLRQQDRADRWIVTATRLFLRGGPGGQFEPIDPPRTITLDTIVDRLLTEGDWAFVEVAAAGPGLDPAHVGVRGWVSTRYLHPA